MNILNWIQKRIFPTIIALSALSVSGSAAFYSVTGLSKLFAGASLQVLVMASSLEIAKLVIASLLYQYWGELNKMVKNLLKCCSICIGIDYICGYIRFLIICLSGDCSNNRVLLIRKLSCWNLKKSSF